LKSGVICASKTITCEITFGAHRTYDDKAMKSEE